MNQLAGTGWLMGDGLKNFISRLLMLKRYLNFVGLEVFTSSGSTRRQVIHSLDFFRSFVSRQKDKHHLKQAIGFIDQKWGNSTLKY